MDNNEINRLVAEKVMGWTAVPSITGDYEIWLDQAGKRRYTKNPSLRFVVVNFSEDIESAWIVVEKLSTKWQWELVTPFMKDNPCYASLTLGGKTDWNDRADIAEAAATMPLAICLLALRAFGVEIEDEPNVDY